jgi:phosphotriesterase-related protein
MKGKERKGKIQTVLGLIEPSQLGITLPHEHLMSDGSGWFVEPADSFEKAMAQRPVSVDILWWLTYHRFTNLDDMILMDEQEAVEEVMAFQLAGGSSVVEMSNIGLGRSPKSLARISRKTGLHILMGSGYYFEQSIRADLKAKSEEQITEEIVEDIEKGVGTTGICAGFIGEIGCTWPLTDFERKSLRASAKAQKITGAALNIHPGQHEDSAMEAVRIVEDAGADLTRTTIDHIDRAVRQRENRIALAKMGVYLEYDLFGREGYYPLEQRKIDLPNDHGRINEIMDLMASGYTKQILISQDIWNKTQRRKYGGWGYAHILDNTLPVMCAKGMSEDEIRTLMVENPARLFAFL